MSIILNRNTDGVRVRPLKERELSQELTPGNPNYGKIIVGTNSTYAGEIIIAKDVDVQNLKWYTEDQVEIINTELSIRYTKDESDFLFEQNNPNIQSHISSTSNPHNVTKAPIGLPNVDNTADIDKNVLSSSKLTSSRDIILGGAVSGTASFDGSTNASINVSINDNSIQLGTHTTGSYVSEIDVGNGLTITESNQIESNIVNLYHKEYTEINAITPADGFSVISSVIVDEIGHVTNVTTRTLSNATTSNIGVTQLNDTLNSSNINQALTANQGRVLKQLYDSLFIDEEW